MRPLDWLVLAGTLLAITLYGIWKGRRAAASAQSYVLAGRETPWWGVAVSVMATQASAITFLSTPGQAYSDGMRFVQFYFGLPFAMMFLCVTIVPRFHRSGVFTAYEYLEQRFDVKTRTLAAVLFLVLRGLSAGFSMYAPAAVLSVLFGWNTRVTTLLIGLAVVLYTTSGGARAVGRTQLQQFAVAIGGMALAFYATVKLLPDGVTIGEAASVAGAAGRTHILDFDFDWQSRYNVWSGLIGGFFLQLSYFGTDQSQVQRYLTAKSVGQSRLGLLFNGLFKIPMQLGILFIGVMVFSVYHFVPAPMYHHPVEASAAEEGPRAAEFREAERNYVTALNVRRDRAMEFIEAGRAGDPERLAAARASLVQAQSAADAVRARGAAIVKDSVGGSDGKDTNYIFLRFVLEHLPAGIVGLVLAVVFCAAMSSSAAELNALATTSMVDVYKRLWRRDAGDAESVRAARVCTVLWAAIAVGFAQYANRLGSLVEAVNVMGSLFYGTILGIFLTGFYIKHVRGTAVCLAALAAEGVVIAMYLGTNVSFLWFNAAGCAAVVTLAPILQRAADAVGRSRRIAE